MSIDPLTDPYDYYADYCRYYELTSGKYFEYYGTNDITVSNSSVQRLIITLHGDGRNAPQSFNNALNATDSLDNVLILAPYFTYYDWERNYRDDVIVWDNGSWSYSGYPDESVYPEGHYLYYKTSDGKRKRVDSFYAYDSLISETLKNNPKIYEILLVGWSAGAQFVQRYLFGSSYLSTLRQNNYSIRPLVVSSGSFAYIDALRADSTLADEYCISDADACANEATSDSGNFWITPSGTECDSTYNLWKYGLDTSTHNHVSVSVDDFSGYQNVRYFLGGDDLNTPTNDGCAAELQGTTRYQRHLVYLQQLSKYSISWNMTIVADCQHNENCVMSTETMKEAFAAGPVTTPTYVSVGDSSSALSNSFFGSSIISLQLTVLLFVFAFHFLLHRQN